jgi:hypothetical protein
MMATGRKPRSSSLSPDSPNEWLRLSDTTVVKRPADAIVWEDGPQDRDCAYHKVATYDAKGGRLQIDVFVSASPSPSCPVRIAVHSSKSPDAQRLALMDPGDADLHLAEIDNHLKKLGLPSVLAAYCAGDVVALIKRDAENIRATQRELARRRRQP